MPRIELELPEAFAFSTELSVRVDDVNFAGHLGHDSVVTLLHEARARLFRRLGGHELDIFGVGIILADLVVVYRAEAFLGDRLVVKIAAGEYSSKGCDLLYLMTRHPPEPEGATPAAQGVEVARAKTGLVFFDYRKRCAVEVPPEFRAGMKQLLAT